MRKGNYILEGREYCKHDTIPRKCELCELEAERDEYREALLEIIQHGGTGEDAKLMHVVAKEALR